MPAKKKKAQINLLPREEFASSPLGRTLSWLVTTFRTIVIVVELVVMIAFLSRFYLDAKLTDLNEELSAAASTIGSFSELESDFRDTQERLETVSNIPKSESVLDKISTSLPPDIILTSINQSASLSIAGISPSERSISQFIVNLKSQGIETQLLSLADDGVLNFVLSNE